MSKGRYRVIDGITRKVKKRYLVIDGVTREIKKSYRVVNGVTRLFYSAMALASYTGTHTVSKVEIDGAAFDLYTLTGSGTLELKGNAQFWMCGGGEAGNIADAKYSDTQANRYARGGYGGSGGYVGSGDLDAGTYTIVIGAGGNPASSAGYAGGATSINQNAKALHTASGGGTVTASSVYGASGGGAGGYIKDAKVQTSTGRKGNGESTIPFGVTSLKKHSAGGGGGMAMRALGTTSMSYYYVAGGAGGSNGANGANGGTAYDTSEPSRAAGGEYGGGKGATAQGQGNAATFYGGGGGGGGGLYSTVDDDAVGYNGGRGYQGVCYILIPA